MGEIREHWDRFQKESATVVAISFSPYKEVAALGKELQLPFPVVSDPDRAVYKAMEAGKMRWRDFFSWSLASEGWKALRKGWWPSLRYDKKDVVQLGGDLVTDAAGEVTFQHLSKSPEDRPSVNLLLGELQRVKS